MGEKKRKAHYLTRAEPVKVLGEIPRFGFKFFDQRWKEDLLDHGSVRITSYSECREYENPLLGDRYEGTQSVFASGIHDGRQLRLDDPKNAFGSVFRPVDKAVHLSNILMGNFTVQQILPDYFLFCYSMECSGTVASSLGYDAVAYIPDVSTIARHMLSFPEFNGYRCIIGRIDYRERIRSIYDADQSTAKSLFEKP